MKHDARSAACALHNLQLVPAQSVGYTQRLEDRFFNFENAFIEGFRDFLVRLDDGHDDPLNLVLEVKGLRDESDKAKAQTMRELWVPGVNALGGFGRWGFAEFRDWATMEQDFAALVERLTRNKK